MADSLDRCFSQAAINGLTLRNRLIKAATFEGKSPGGVPSEALVGFHERIGQGGVGMTTIAYCAAESDGRIHEDMMYMHEGIRSELELFIRTVQATGARVSGQLGHCGAFTKNKDFGGMRPLGPSKGTNALGLVHGLGRIAEMTKPEIRDRAQVIGRAATFMKSVGFDAIEIHFGHGYGISQFISPKTNKRKDEYGGSLQNRMRFALEVLSEVRNSVGDDYPLLGKISMTDGVPGGVSYDDSVEIAAMLEAGGLDVIICSGGTSSMNPMLLFRGDSMVPGLIKHEKSRLMKIGIRLAAPLMFKDYPYEETYFLEQAQRIRDRVQCGVCYIGGVCTNDSIRTVMDAGFDFIQLGRALIFDPDFPKQARARSNYRNGCSHCNQCATLIEAPGGIYCVERPANFS
ncbi:MAG: NADH:flavin oxidoreductase [Polyangiales bacterium]|jgi:2,4-dienoyl-CoA reductase-like NADH-dependent reductase (Old Yellow Enzyme family)